MRSLDPIHIRGLLPIAEATIHGTPLVGKELKDVNLREEYGVNVVGMWERGHFELPEPDAMLNNHTVLLMAGMDANFKKYDKNTLDDAKQL